MTGSKTLSKDIEANVKTPAFIYDERAIIEKIALFRGLVPRETCNLLFPLKCFSIYEGLRTIAGAVDGFSVSSLFEAQIARYLDRKIQIHLTTPGLKRDDMPSFFSLCDYISFNSLSQFEMANEIGKAGSSFGLRVNPQLSFIRDKRYNPCRIDSKLGVPLEVLSRMVSVSHPMLESVEGIHFHSNCESTDFNSLVITLEKIESMATGLFDMVNWINLGGGYLFNKPSDLDGLIELVLRLKNRYNVQVFFEPGKAIVGDAGYIVASVVDVFDSDAQSVAVLDTTVNHMPEVFEYQYKPHVTRASRNGEHRYVLAGCSCLSGDLFGTYRFKEPLSVGSRVTFSGVGAYTMVKANMFNGINLPAVYGINQKGMCELKVRFEYKEYLSRCGVRDAFA
jgi:carboxynorspermidine decarboxylase